MSIQESGIGHVTRHRAAGPATRMLRKVRWLRVTHPRRPAPSSLELAAACRAATPNTK
ncbi:hypothetical protein ACPPVO_58635 [Dactylosporangium sp. McL0621]|uniref:hypothetical protein n=1 Tax=Dactylosporangium sp. McL0621 TaxID=3415678 RepID=UPI003CF4559F